MRKGISKTMIFKLFLLIIAVAVIVGFISAYIVPGFGSPFKLWEWDFSEKKPEVLEEAIKCAYYRCFKGCSKAIAEVDLSIFPECEEEFCKAEWQDENGKICSSDVDKRVVVYTEKVTITKEFWRNLLKDEAHPLGGLGHCPTAWPYRSECPEDLCAEGAVDDYWAEWALIFPNSAECEDVDGIDSCTLKPGTYAIFSKRLFEPMLSNPTAFICEHVPLEENLPIDKDAWTEKEDYLDCWYHTLGRERKRSDDSAVNSYSIHFKSLGIGVAKFSPGCVGETIIPWYYSKLHFFIKAPIDSDQIIVSLKLSGGATVYCRKDYTGRGDWQELTISLLEECPYLSNGRELEVIDELGFQFRVHMGEMYIDGLYFSQE